MKTHKLFKVLSIGFAALVLAACGGAEDSAGDETGGSEDTTTVSVALENDSRPLTYTDETGELTGYEVDLINALEEVIEGYNFEVEAVDADATQVGLDTGRYQMIGGGLYKTAERQEAYLFPEEHTGASIIEIWRREGDTQYESLADLADENARVVPPSPNGGIFNLLNTWNEENPNHQIEFPIQEPGTTAETLQQVDNGEYDVLIHPSNLGQDEIIEELGLNIENASEPIQVIPTYFVLGQDQEDLKTAVDDALAQLKEDGTLTELSEKWFGEDIFEYDISEESIN